MRIKYLTREQEDEAWRALNGRYTRRPRGYVRVSACAFLRVSVPQCETTKTAFFAHRRFLTLLVPQHGRGRLVVADSRQYDIKTRLCRTYIYVHIYVRIYIDNIHASHMCPRGRSRYRYCHHRVLLCHTTHTCSIHSASRTADIVALTRHGEGGTR